MAGFPKELWYQILSQINVEDLCDIARISSMHYKLVGMDFRRLCARNNIYRLPGELWCKAFRNLPQRRGDVERSLLSTHGCYLSGGCTLNRRRSKIASSKDSDKVAFVGESWVAITSLDLEKNFLRIIEFPAPNVESVFIDRKGATVTLITGRSILYAYDVQTGRQIRCESARKAQRIGDVYWCYHAGQRRRIQNILTSRWHSLSIDEEVVWIEDSQCLNPKYLIIQTATTTLYVMETRDGKTNKLTQFPEPRIALFFLNKKQHLLVRSKTWKYFEIYDLKTRSLLFTHCSEERRWEIFGDNSLVSAAGTAVIYHAQAKEWKYADLSKHAIWTSAEYVPESLTSLNEHAQDIAVVELSSDEPVRRDICYGTSRKERLFLVLLNRQKLQFTPFKDNNKYVGFDPFGDFYMELLHVKPDRRVRRRFY